MRTARPPRRAARECVRTSGPSAAPRPVGREGGGDPNDQRGGGWSGHPARRSRSCTWSSASCVSLSSCSRSCCVSFLLVLGSSRSSSSPLVLVVQQPALLGQHPLGPRRRIPQLHPVDGSVHQHLGARVGRTSASGRVSACAPAGRFRPRPSWTPRYGPGCDRRARRPPSPASLPSAARTPRVSTTRGSPRNSGSGSRRARTGRGTSRAGSPCPSCRANARISLRSLPPALSPTTLPGLRPLTPPHTTARHFTPFSSTSQPPRPPATQLQPPALPTRLSGTPGSGRSGPRDGHRAAPFRSLPAASRGHDQARGRAGRTVPPDRRSAEEEQPEEEETKSGGEEKRKEKGVKKNERGRLCRRSERRRAAVPSKRTRTSPAGDPARARARRRADRARPGPRPVAPGRAPARRARHRRSPPAPAAARDPTADSAGREQGALPRPPLREAHHLPRTVEDLAGPAPREAHELAELPGTERPVCTSKPCCPTPASALVHHAPTHSAATDTSSTQSGSSRGIQASNQSCSPGPRRRLLPRPAAGPAPAPLPHRDAAHELPRLGAAQHQGRAGHVAGDGHPPRLGTEPLDVEGRRGGRGRGRQPQEAAARYGSHNGSTSARWRSRQRWPSGGAGFTRSVQPSSERS